MTTSIRFNSLRATRRNINFVCTLAMLLLLAGMAFAGLASALTMTPYSPKAVAEAQAKGEATALLFHADWCPTCKKQMQTLEALQKNSTRDITIFVVNYDKSKRPATQLESAHAVHVDRVPRADGEGASCWGNVIHSNFRCA